MTTDLGMQGNYRPQIRYSVLFELGLAEEVLQDYQKLLLACDLGWGRNDHMN